MIELLKAFLAVTGVTVLELIAVWAVSKACPDLEFEDYVLLLEME